MTVNLRPLLAAEGGDALLRLSGLTPGRSYRLAILPVREPATRLEQSLTADSEGALAWSQPVTWRGEALCDIYSPEGSTPLATAHLYAAPPEILRRRPLRCDLHIHTTYSDGKNSPLEMILRGRELGLDALAITDHNRYDGTLEAMAAARRLEMGLICLPGEEVSARDWHLLAINTREAVGWDRALGGYAGLREALERIHGLGGHAYLAHPYWTLERRHYMPSADYDRLLAEGGLDGIELIGDVDWEDTLRSLARYGEACAVGPAYPILGCSDTHRAGHTIGGMWTLAWAREATAEGILEAIAGRYTAACALLTLAPPGATARARFQAFGPFELVDLAIFLDHHYFPQHDALCRQEAELARRAAAGDALPVGAMARVAAELEAWRRECWG